MPRNANLINNTIFILQGGLTLDRSITNYQVRESGMKGG
jgi:hypothetical protein